MALGLIKEVAKGVNCQSSFDFNYLKNTSGAREIVQWSRHLQYIQPILVQIFST